MWSTRPRREAPIEYEVTWNGSRGALTNVPTVPDPDRSPLPGPKLPRSSVVTALRRALLAVLPTDPEAAITLPVLVFRLKVSPAQRAQVANLLYRLRTEGIVRSRSLTGTTGRRGRSSLYWRA